MERIVGVVVWCGVGGRLLDNAKAIIDDSCCGRARNRTNQGLINTDDEADCAF